MAECMSSKHNHSSNSAFTQQCVQRCQVATNQASNVMQQEMGQFQNRVQRSMMSCQDEANDHVVPNMSQQKIDSLQLQMEKCGGKGIQNHISLLPNIEKKIEATLRNLKN